MNLLKIPLEANTEYTYIKGMNSDALAAQQHTEDRLRKKYEANEEVINYFDVFCACGDEPTGRICIK